MIGGTGILLNNQLNNFSHEEAWRARRDRRPEPPNAMQPGKRMLSTMVPTILFKGGKPWLVVGTPGGSTIITTVAQVIVNVVDHGLDQACDAAGPNQTAAKPVLACRACSRDIVPGVVRRNCARSFVSAPAT